MACRDRRRWSCPLYFHRDSDASAAAALLTIGVAVALVFPAVAWYDAARALLPMGLGVCLWLLLLCIALVALAPACLALAAWRIRRARQGDVGFESARR